MVSIARSPTWRRSRGATKVPVKPPNALTPASAPNIHVGSPARFIWKPTWNSANPIAARMAPIPKAADRTEGADSSVRSTTVETGASVCVDGTRSTSNAPARYATAPARSTQAALAPWRISTANGDASRPAIVPVRARREFTTTRWSRFSTRSGTIEFRETWYVLASTSRANASG